MFSCHGGNGEAICLGLYYRITDLRILTAYEITPRIYGGLRVNISIFVVLGMEF
jgi:hypothetical protein